MPVCPRKTLTITLFWLYQLSLDAFKQFTHIKVSLHVFFRHKHFSVQYCTFGWNSCRVDQDRLIQGGAEPTDTFQMVIDNIWKRGKISETVYKYVQVCYLLPTDYKLIFWKLRQADGLRLHQYVVASVSGSCRTRNAGVMGN